jgi:hypothetical protein
MPDFSHHSPIYSFSTENLEALADLLKKHSHYRRVLTIGGSGDQAIVCAMHGAKNIINVDINQQAYYYAMLKFKALEHFTYQEFCQFFLRNQPKSFDRHLFYLLLPFLSEDVSSFWQAQYHQQAGIQIRESMLFNNLHDQFENKKLLSYYLRNESLYLQAQKHWIAQKHHVQWVINTMDSFLQECLVQEKYDLILLSNLADYSHKMYVSSNENEHLFKFKKHFVLPAIECLNTHGGLEIAYIFDALNLHHSDLRNAINSGIQREQLYGHIPQTSYHEFSVKSALNLLDKQYHNEDRLCFLEKLS